MSEASRNRFFQRAILGAWAFITLVLAVVVFLLLNERTESTRAPQGTTGHTAANRGPAAPPPPRAGENERTVRLYFALPDASGLMPETRPIAYGDSTVGNCRAALEAIIAGPRADLAPVLPPTASVRALFVLEGGRLIVDLSREVAQGLPRSTAAEALFVQSIAHTLSQPELRAADDTRISSVRVLIEGFPAENSFASHLDFSDFITPDPAWVQQAQPAA